MHIGLGADSRGDPGTPGRSPAERQPITFHRADLVVAFRPAELFRAKLKALEEMTRRKWNAQSLVDLRFVEGTELDGIDLELIRQFVHRRLCREETRHSTGAAHVGGCADIALGASELYLKVRHTVMERGRFTATFVVSIEH